MRFLEAICEYPFYNVAPFHLSFLSERFNCVMLCTNLNPLSPACATFLAELCNPITRQAIELESFSNPLRIQPVLHLKSIKKFRYRWGVFGGNATSGGVFSYLYLALGPKPLGHCYGSRFFWKQGQNLRL